MYTALAARAGLETKGTAYSFVVKRDERYLKDIEKLVDKAFVREELEGFVPGVRAPREERGGRTPGRTGGRTEGAVMRADQTAAQPEPMMKQRPPCVSAAHRVICRTKAHVSTTMRQFTGMPNMSACAPNWPKHA